MGVVSSRDISLVAIDSFDITKFCRKHNISGERMLEDVTAFSFVDSAFLDTGNYMFNLSMEGFATNEEGESIDALLSGFNAEQSNFYWSESPLERLNEIFLAQRGVVASFNRLSPPKEFIKFSSEIKLSTRPERRMILRHQAGSPADLAISSRALGSRRTSALAQGWEFRSIITSVTMNAGQARTGNVTAKLRDSDNSGNVPAFADVANTSITHDLADRTTWDNKIFFGGTTRVLIAPVWGFPNTVASATVLFLALLPKSVVFV